VGSAHCTLASLSRATLRTSSMAFVVKNTFICEVVSEALDAPGPRPQQRAKTVHYWPCCSAETLPQAADADAPGWAEEPAYAATVGAILDAMPALAFDGNGCTLVQQVLESASGEEMRQVAASLRGSVRLAAHSPYAHHLLEHLLHHLGIEDTSFIAEELKGGGRELVLNEFGSSVLCQLLLFSTHDPSTEQLIEEVLSGDTTAVCHHKHGHKVALAILEHGSPRQRSQICVSLRGEVPRSSRHRFAAQVVAEALLHGAAEDSHSLAVAVVCKPGAVTSLACHCFGVQVVRSLLRLPRISGAVLQELNTNGHKLKKDKFGAEIMMEIGLHAGACDALAPCGGA